MSNYFEEMESQEETTSTKTTSITSSEVAFDYDEEERPASFESSTFTVHDQNMLNSMSLLEAQLLLLKTTNPAQFKTIKEAFAYPLWLKYILSFQPELINKSFEKASNNQDRFESNRLVPNEIKAYYVSKINRSKTSDHFMLKYEDHTRQRTQSNLDITLAHPFFPTIINNSTITCAGEDRSLTLMIHMRKHFSQSHNLTVLAKLEEARFPKIGYYKIPAAEQWLNDNKNKIQDDEFSRVMVLTDLRKLVHGTFNTPKNQLRHQMFLNFYRMHMELPQVDKNDEGIAKLLLAHKKITKGVDEFEKQSFLAKDVFLTPRDLKEVMAVRKMGKSGFKDMKFKVMGLRKDLYDFDAWTNQGISVIRKFYTLIQEEEFTKGMAFGHSDKNNWAALLFQRGINQVSGAFTYRKPENVPDTLNCKRKDGQLESVLILSDAYDRSKTVLRGLFLDYVSACGEINKSTTRQTLVFKIPFAPEADFELVKTPVNITVCERILMLFVGSQAQRNGGKYPFGNLHFAATFGKIGNGEVVIRVSNYKFDLSTYLNFRGEGSDMNGMNLFANNIKEAMYSAVYWGNILRIHHFYNGMVDLGLRYRNRDEYLAYSVINTNAAGLVENQDLVLTPVVKAVQDPKMLMDRQILGKVATTTHKIREGEQNLEFGTGNKIF